MANICDFSMMVVGYKQNIERFKRMMTQEGNEYMGRGAAIEYEDMMRRDDGKYRCRIDGTVKWSILSSLTDSAIRMSENVDDFYFGDGVDVSQISFFTLREACRNLQLDMEVFSDEGCDGFQEHYKIVLGEVVRDECIEYSPDDYDELTSSDGLIWDVDNPIFTI